MSNTAFFWDNDRLNTHIRKNKLSCVWCVYGSNDKEYKLELWIRLDNNRSDYND